LGHCLQVSRTRTRPFDVPKSVLAIDHVRRVLGWSPRVSLSDGIARTLADLKANRAFSTLSD
jgi:nucleoside-diphosphate-sugar epimerase